MTKQTETAVADVWDEAIKIALDVRHAIEALAGEAISGTAEMAAWNAQYKGAMTVFRALETAKSASLATIADPPPTTTEAPCRRCGELKRHLQSCDYQDGGVDGERSDVRDDERTEAEQESGNEEQNIMPTSRQGSERQEQGLLPCPFCGKPAEFIDPGYVKSRVRCSNPDDDWCIGGEVSATPTQWNSRAATQATASASAPSTAVPDERVLQPSPESSESSSSE